MTDHLELSRRHILAAGTVAAGAALLTPSIATAAPDTTPSTTPGSMSSTTAGAPFSAYHGVNGATHQQKFNGLSGQGYRIESLSVYGDRNNPQYAAIWV
ncbi:MAG: hypothetical protein H0T78_07775, partial [Longispora sp.]|nr:hypothetical protein [Longispora sp. (in: high G+C Gram-positive bacteria)]